MSLMRLEPPTQALVTLEEMRRDLRLDAGGDPLSHPEDDLLTELVQAATDLVDGADGILGRALLTQRWRLLLPGFPAGPITLPLPPLRSVERLAYRAQDGQEEVLQDLDVYPGEPGQIQRSKGSAWPPTASDPFAVTIDFTAGYGDRPEDVPAPLRAAVRQIAAYWFELREQAGRLPAGINDKLASWRLWEF